jgi:hypothetical protein
MHIVSSWHYNADSVNNGWKTYIIDIKEEWSLIG